MKNRRREHQAWSPDSELIYTRHRIERACPENQPTLRRYARWLREDRGLAPSTITTRMGTTCTFVDEVTDRAGTTCAKAFSSLSAADIEDIFTSYGRKHRPASRRSMQGSMRSFLEFSVDCGWVRRELVEAVPSLPVCRLSGLPSGLKDEDLSTVLSSPWKPSICQHRDRAIVLLLATYGARRGQVSALQFEDIDWLERTIIFEAHKGGKSVYHDLTQAVAESLADYLRAERPDSDSSYVFLRHTRPYVRLNPSAISMLVKTRMENCGLPPRYPHSFRQAFATRLLRSDQLVKAIADLLGHRSLEAVAIYAKVDHARLLEVAIDWPEEATP